MTDPTPAEALKAGTCRVEVLRDMDVPKGAWGWLDVIALEGEPPHRRIENPPDAETIVYWQDEQPAAIVLNLRDQFNHSIQYRLDLRPLSPTPDAGEVRTYREGVVREWRQPTDSEMAWALVRSLLNAIEGHELQRREIVHEDDAVDIDTIYERARKIWPAMERAEDFPAAIRKLP